MVFTIERPKPVPFAAGLVVKKGSKILFLIKGFIPVPLSETVISLYVLVVGRELFLRVILSLGLVLLVMVIFLGLELRRLR